MSAELALLVIATAAAGVAALFAILSFSRSQRLPDALTALGARQILRAETDIVRSTVADRPAAFDRSWSFVARISGTQRFCLWHIARRH